MNSTLSESNPLPDIAKSNHQHDLEHGDPFKLTRIRPAWNDGMLLRRGKLTDRKINQYEQSGYYSEAFRSARREIWEQKAKKRLKREGNFDVAEDGRLIYRP